MNSSPGADADNWSPLSQFKSNSLSPGPGLSFEENDLVKEPIQIPAGKSYNFLLLQVLLLLFFLT
jgi:hypothetical protein